MNFVSLDRTQTPLPYSTSSANAGPFVISSSQLVPAKGREFPIQDLQQRREKCLTDAAECEMIALLATDPTKRETFKRLAERLKFMAADIDMAIETMRERPGG